MGLWDTVKGGLGLVSAPMTGGASLGMAGDRGRNILNGLPFIGGTMKGIFGDPEQEAMQRAMAEAQEKMAMQRSNMMDARMNAMNQGALAFGPRNQMLGQMMGQRDPGAQAMDIGPMLQNPMPMNMQQDIRTAAFGSAPPTNAPPGYGGQPQAPGGAFTGTGPQNPYRRQ